MISLDIKNAVEKKFFNNGKLRIEIPYFNGKIHGEMKEYYENGRLQNIIPFQNGLPHGSSKAFSLEGQLKHEVKWFMGKIINTLWIDK
ncbi:MAG: hypothetical protein OEV44_07920 [Spirochaetota bacterium]|nr:hypothetical protein [Spirochaetota bacterium]